jgi:hypothetical protein
MRVGLLYFADEAGAPGRALKRLDGRSFSDPALRHVGAIMQRNREVSRRGVATAPPKYACGYFSASRSRTFRLAKVIRWEADDQDADGVMTPEEIMNKLEERVGPEGRKLFERFLRDVNELGRNGNWRRGHGWVSPNPQVNGRRFSRQPL